MKNLSDILSNSLRDQWKNTDAAREFALLPEGEYTARIVNGELMTSRTGTPSYKLTFRISEGVHEGRQVWHDIWLTPASVPMAKRELTKLGVTDLEQLERPIPTSIRCRIKLVVQQGDNGVEYNKVRRFDVLDIETPEPEPFAPREEYDDGSNDVD